MTRMELIRPQERGNAQTVPVRLFTLSLLLARRRNGDGVGADKDGNQLPELRSMQTSRAGEEGKGGGNSEMFDFLNIFPGNVHFFNKKAILKKYFKL